MEQRILKKKRGSFYTPDEVFERYILPRVRDVLWSFTWVDLYCGRGDLVAPLVRAVDVDERNEFFSEHVRCFDIDEQALSTFAARLVELGVNKQLVERNLKQADTLLKFPDFDHSYPIYHITNPPYLYRGYMPKTEKTRELLKYFEGEREPLQDLYQVALFNDLKKGVERMVYIIPTNFLYGDANANHIRQVMFKHYNLTGLYILEKRVFAETGTNTCVCFFERKLQPSEEDQIVEAMKISTEGERKRVYRLSKKFKWRAGSEFYEFVERFRAEKPLTFRYYLMKREVDANRGDHEVVLLDVNSYKKRVVKVNKLLHDRIKSNPLFLKTLDTGRVEGRAGLYECREALGVDGIMVSKNYTYRTHPIQIFFDKPLTHDEQMFVKEWFNHVLNRLREELDSDFMTTYRESTKYYTRKYLGLNQARALIETCPLLDISSEERKSIESLDEWIAKYLENRKTSKLDAQKQHTLLEYLGRKP
ncbi:MAG: N-6 DNA methylase [Candidatus Caldarchaeum sp.]|nr:N-6 DNA methylase [Candidatus Caldarchaeum sp.]